MKILSLCGICDVEESIAPLLLSGKKKIWNCYVLCLSVGDYFSTLNWLPTKQMTSAYISEWCLKDGVYQTD